MMGDLAAAIVLGLAAVQPGDADPVRQFTAIQEQLATAWVASDLAVIERIIAPEWSLTGPDGQIATRADVFRDVFETRTHRIVAIAVDDVRVKVFGDAAV